MDNKQDRLFYWEVKDFLTKTKNPDINSVKRASSLKEDITKIMSLNSPFYVDKDLVQPRISDDIRNSVLPLIALNESSIKKGTPRNVGSSPNITSNLFNLTEAPAQSFGSLGGGASSGGSVRRRPENQSTSWKDRSPENRATYDANIAAAGKQKEDRETQRGINKRRAQEDEALAYNNSAPEDSMLQGPTPSGGNVGDQAKLQMDKDNPNLPADTPQNRQKLTKFRTNNDNERQSTQLAGVIDRTSKQDPSTLSAKDAGELALAKIMMKGGSLSKPNAGLEASIRSKVAGMQGKPVLSSELSSNISSFQQEDDIAALAAAKKTPEEAAKEAAARTRSKAYFDADTESTFDVSRDATKRDVAQRDQQNRADAAQQAADRKEKMQGVKIQGTNMTYGEFKSNTGRDYDATNKDDSSLVIKQAGAMGGRYSSEEARQTAASADNLINLQKTASDARAVESGKRKRDIDKSAQELSDFKYNPTIRAREMAKQQADLMPQIMAQINKERVQQGSLENAGRLQAAEDKAKIAADKETALKASLEKNSIRIPSKTYVEPGEMGPPKPKVPFMLGGTEQRPAKKPFLPTPTGNDDDYANMVARDTTFKSDLEKYSTGIPNAEPEEMGPPKPDSFMLNNTQQIPEKQPFLPTRTGVGDAAYAAGRAEEKAKRQEADSMFVNGKINPEYQKDLDMASGKISNKLYGNQTGYPLGDESLVTIPQDEFSDVNVVGGYKTNDPDLENTSPNLVQDTINNRANLIRQKARREAETTRSKRLEAQKQKAEAEKQTKLQTAEDERQQREYEMQRSSPPPSLLSGINPNEGPRPEFNTPPSEYGPSLLGDIMQSGASTTPGTSTTSRPAVAPGSPKAIEDQLKRLRGQ